MTNKEYTTDIEEFLSGHDFETEEDKDNLTEALKTKVEVGDFNVWMHNGQTFVKGASDTILRLPTEKAERELLRQLDEIEIEDEDDPDLGYRRAIQSPKS